MTGYSTAEALMNVNNLATNGEEELKIKGKNMGPVDAEVSIVAFGTTPDLDRFEAAGCYVTIAHEEVLCITPPGAGKDISWTIIIDGIESQYDLTAYAPPQVTGVTIAAAEIQVAGGDRIVILGTNFGPASPNDFLQEVSYGVRYIIRALDSNFCLRYNFIIVVVQDNLLDF